MTMTGETRKIDHSNVPEQIYRRIREMILRGQLKSGEALKIDAVARQFDVSAIPAREAMRMLEADHLIEILPHRSPVVSGLSRGEVLEIAEIRLTLEPLALADSVPHLTEKALRSSGDILQKYQVSTDVWEQIELNRQFHLTLYEECGKGRLMKIIESQYDGMTRCAQFMVIRADGEESKSLREHRAILEACRARDTGTAVERLRTHLEASIERLRREFADEEGRRGERT
ncbi:MAG: GntR family transcriptional regulator [Alphaproteobacteria bacterium]|nr:GntR family transcriptional regulator [Alphaproteobacteria bacterium]